jgi:hypothetical protein
MASYFQIRALRHVYQNENQQARDACAIEPSGEKSLAKIEISVIVRDPALQCFPGKLCGRDRDAEAGGAADYDFESSWVKLAAT